MQKKLLYSDFGPWDSVGGVMPCHIFDQTSVFSIYIWFWFWGQDVGSDCISSWSLLIVLLLQKGYTVSFLVSLQQSESLLVDHFSLILAVEKLFIRFSANAFRKLPSIYIFSYFPFGFEGRLWDLIVSVPDHCLSFYFFRKATLSRS